MSETCNINNDIRSSRDYVEYLRYIALLYIYGTALKSSVYELMKTDTIPMKCEAK